MTVPVTAKLVILVLDGLRPDVIDASRTPHMAALRRRGTWYSASRTVFPSLTRVATASIATGTRPHAHGVVSNAFYDPRFDGDRLHNFASEDQLRRYEERVGEPFVAGETFADLLAAAGRRFAMVHTGSSASAFILSPRYRELRQWKFSVANFAAGMPSPVHDGIQDRYGPLPEDRIPGTAVVDYAATIFVEEVLARQSPDAALLWLYEPDKTWHYRGINSSDGLAALAAADDAVGRVVDWVDGRPDADAYTILLLSDHGHAQTPTQVDLYDLLRAEGYSCRHAEDGLLGDDAFAVTGWTVGSVWPRSGGVDQLRAVAEWLRAQDFVGCAHPRQAPLMFSVAVDDSACLGGLPGTGFVIGGRDARRLTMHGGLSRAELSNTMIAVGSGYEPGAIDTRACGILDIAPTILATLGVPQGPGMTGRPVSQPALPTDTPVTLAHGEVPAPG